jgi:hypothetical protein
VQPAILKGQNLEVFEGGGMLYVLLMVGVSQVHASARRVCTHKSRSCCVLILFVVGFFKSFFLYFSVYTNSQR